MQSYDMTPKQYHEHIVRECMREYECSRADAEYQRTALDTNEEHFALVFSAVKGGVQIRRQVLDALTDGQRYRIFHDIPGTHPWYLAPAVRKINRDHEAAMRAIRHKH